MCSKLNIQSAGQPTMDFHHTYGFSDWTDHSYSKARSGTSDARRSGLVPAQSIEPADSGNPEKAEFAYFLAGPTLFILLVQTQGNASAVQVSILARTLLINSFELRELFAIEAVQWLHRQNGMTPAE